MMLCTILSRRVPGFLGILLWLFHVPWTIEGFIRGSLPIMARVTSSSSASSFSSLYESTVRNGNIIIPTSSNDDDNDDEYYYDDEYDDYDDDDDYDDVTKLQAAVLVPGFLTGAAEFEPLCELLTSEYGIPTIAVPMPNWHWISCLGGRSSRPILERIDWTVQQLIAHDGNISAIPTHLLQYTWKDAWIDFRTNPGGIFQVGGSDQVNQYPIVQPQGTFPLPNRQQLFQEEGEEEEEEEFITEEQEDTNDDDSTKTVTTSVGGVGGGGTKNPPMRKKRRRRRRRSKKKVALIGHSAGGWISRIYLSSRNYGGRAYKGTDHVHSLVTLGTPHATASHPAFNGIEWCNQEENEENENEKENVVGPGTSTRTGKLLAVPTLTVGGCGYKGNEWGSLTQNSYAFCCPEASNGTEYDGDGLTPVFSSLGLPGAETLLLEDVSHFCWSDVFGGNLLAPELSAAYKQGRPWYGSPSIVSKWAEWLIRQCHHPSQKPQKDDNDNDKDDNTLQDK